MKIRDIITASVTIVLAVALTICAPDLGAAYSFTSEHLNITLAVAWVVPQLDNDRLIPDPIVAREWLGVCLRTLARWDENPSLGFPAPRRINKRKFRLQSELIAFMRAGSVARVSDRTVPCSSDESIEHSERAPADGEAF